MRKFESLRISEYRKGIWKIGTGLRQGHLSEPRREDMDRRKNGREGRRKDFEKEFNNLISNEMYRK